MRDYRVTLTVKNNYLLSAMKRAGISTATELAAKANVTPAEVGGILALKAIPFKRKTGKANGELHADEYRHPVLRIAGVLNTHPLDLFPAQHHHRPLGKNTAEAHADLSDIALLLCAEQASPEDSLISDELEGLLPGAIKEALSALTPREEAVLKLRFGLDGEKPHTLEQIAERYSVTRERMRQIEAKALRKLRHPSRRKALEIFRP